MPHRRSTIAAGAFVLAASVLAPPAGSQPGFISDVTTLSSHQSAGQYAVALALDGTAHAIWVEETGGTFLLMAASRPRGGAWTAPVQVDTASTTQDAEPSMAVDGQGRVVVAWRDYLPERAGSLVRTATLAGGTWSAAQELSPTTSHAFEPRVAVDGRGDAVVVWLQSAGADQRQVRAAYRPAGGSWAGSEVTAAPGSPSATAVALQPDGRAVAVWTQDGTVQTAARAPGADSPWTAPRQLSRSSGQGPGIVTDATGQVTAAWTAASVTGASTVESATLPVGGDWGATSTLGTAPSGGLAWQLDLGIGPTGEALAAWVVAGEGNTTSDLFTASRAANGTWRTTALASPHAYNSSPTVGFGSRGAGVVMWTGSAEQLTSSRTLYAATRTPGRPWTDATALATGSVAGPTAAVDPDGHGTLVWSESGGALRTQVFDGVAPTIEEFSAPVFVRTGRVAAYRATASDLWSAPTLSWRFGDRAPVAGSAVTRAFRSGVQRVRLTVTDAARNTTTRRSVTIVAGEKPRLRSLRLSEQAIRVRGPEATKRTRLSFRLGAPALVRVQALTPSGRLVATVERALDRGARGLTLTADRLDLRRGTYALRVSARNVLGRSVSARLPLRVTR